MFRWLHTALDFAIGGYGWDWEASDSCDAGGDEDDDPGEAWGEEVEVGEGRREDMQSKQCYIPAQMPGAGL